MSVVERRIFFCALALAGVVGVSLGSIARGTGGAAITLLIASLAMSPIAQVVSAPHAVACRAARRTLGITSAGLACVHALFALSRYLDPLVLEPIAALPWLRHGALALALLVTLALTSFAAVQRALRVRAWSALHRLVYPAAILACFHALAVPFGSSRVGIAASVLTSFSLLVRPVAQALRRPRPGED